MTDGPSRAIRLYGTEEQVDPPRILRAGPLSADFEAGNLRYIRFGGAEVMRAISFIVRDRDWGTYNPRISDLKVEETGDRFLVTYRAETSDREQGFAYEARIEGHADGRLVFEGRGEALTDFTTNRTGFVILHAADLAGSPVGIEHVDGRRVDGAFPRLIDPVQPMMDLRALTHRQDGLTVTCRMEGDTFEMEDQRNWTDASYKTYVRPLALPWPYELKKGDRLEQTVTLTIEGEAPRAVDAGAVRIVVGAAGGTMPAIGQGLDPDDAEDALRLGDTIAELGVAHLICHHDSRRGHGRETLARQVEVARAMGAEPWLEAVITEVEGFEAEVERLGETVRTLGSPFATVMVSPASDLKCTLPGSEWPPAAPAEPLYEATRRAFPKARIGGGMFSYFTELNRKRPPEGRLDLISFTTSGVVHAGDDRSVMETILALPWIAESVRAIAGGTEWAVGPSAIGMRENPYGSGPKDNPENIRQAMSFNDPRQRGLFGAAWYLGYAAAFASGGASAVALAAPVGAFGVAHGKRPFPQPWFDEEGGLFPVFHVLRGLARLRGARLHAIQTRPGGRVAGLAARMPGGGTEVWLANLGAEPVAVELEGRVAGRAILDAASFVEAAGRPDLLDRLDEGSGAGLDLDAYAVARLRLAS